MAGIEFERALKCLTGRRSLAGEGLGIAEIVPGARLVGRQANGGLPQADFIPIVLVAVGSEDRLR